MTKTIGVGFGLILAVLPAAGWTATATTGRVLPAALALEAAEMALSTCTAQGFRVSVSIVDREGIQRVLIVGDGAGPVSITTSRRKAYTSAALGVSTGDMQRQSNGAPPPPIDPEILALAGGLPIRAGDQVIAAIGVGGADRSDKDEACAAAGLDKIKDRLN